MIRQLEINLEYKALKEKQWEEDGEKEKYPNLYFAEKF